MVYFKKILKKKKENPYTFNVCVCVLADMTKRD